MFCSSSPSIGIDSCGGQLRMSKPFLDHVERDALAHYFSFKRVEKYELQGLGAVTKGEVGIHVLLRRSLFVCDILRKLLLRVSEAKPTSAPLRF
jgi:hypothetical protein